MQRAGHCVHAVLACTAVALLHAASASGQLNPPGPARGINGFFIGDDFETDEPYIIVKLDERCRRQQFGEGWFPTIEAVPDTAISDASFQDGQIKFAVTRELNGQKFTTKYEGRIEGNTIKGTFERGGANIKGPSKSEWLAKRS